MHRSIFRGVWSGMVSGRTLRQTPSKFGSNERRAVSQPQTASSSASAPAKDVGPFTAVTTSSIKPTAVLASGIAVSNAAAQPTGPQQTQTLWAKAYERVARTGPGILQPFEARGGSFEDLQCMRKIVNERLEDRADSQLVIKLAGKSVRIREISDKVLSFVLWSKDLIGAALSSDPHAQLAWTGVSLVLTLVASSQLQNESLLSGLQIICNLLPIYKIREDLYVAGPGGNVDFEESIVQLYAKIVEYAARAIRHLDRSAARRHWDDISSKEDWAGQIKAIVEQDTACSALSRMIDVLAEREQWKLQFGQLALQTTLQQSLVKALDDMRLAQREHYLDEKKEKMKQCLQSLSWFDRGGRSYRDEKDFNDPKVPGTCEWLLQDRRFREWEESEGPNLLFISADPGCGKSVLAKALVDDRSVCPSIVGTTLCYFFFKQRGSRASAWSAVLHQLFDQNQDQRLLEHALSAHSKYGPNLKFQSEELWNILVATARDKNAGQIVVVLDALDECDAHECELLLDRMSALMKGNIVDASRINLKFCITSRAEGRIERRIEAMTISAKAILIRGEDYSDAIGVDIDLVIEDRVPKKASQLSPKQQSDLIQHLKSMSKRTYLWLKLVLEAMADSIIADPPGDDVTRLTKKLPKTVPEAYSKILERSRFPQSIVRKLLMIIAAAQDPLSVQDVNIALAIARDDEPCKSFASLKLFPAEHAKTNIKNICGLLLTVSRDKVYFLHETAREFVLGTIPGMGPGLEWQQFPEASAHELMARVCLAVPSFQEIVDATKTRLVGIQELSYEKDGEWRKFEPGALHGITYRGIMALLHATEGRLNIDFGDSANDDEEFPFFCSYLLPGQHEDDLHRIVKYASIHWPIHWRKSSVQRSSPLYQAAKDMCDLTTSDGKIHRLLTYSIQDFRYCPPVDMASFHGLELLVNELLDELVSIDGTRSDRACMDEIIAKALSAAILGRQASTAAMLLDRLVTTVAKPLTPLTSALSTAIASGNTAIWRVLADYLPRDPYQIEFVFGHAIRYLEFDLCDTLLDLVSYLTGARLAVLNRYLKLYARLGGAEAVSWLLWAGATDIVPAMRDAKAHLASADPALNHYFQVQQTLVLLEAALRNSNGDVPSSMRKVIESGVLGVSDLCLLLRNARKALKDVRPGGYLYGESSSELWEREAQRQQEVCKILLEALLQLDDDVLLHLKAMKARIENEAWNVGHLHQNLQEARQALEDVLPGGCLYGESSSDRCLREAERQKHICKLLIEALMARGDRLLAWLKSRIESNILNDEDVADELRSAVYLLHLVSPGGRLYDEASSGLWVREEQRQTRIIGLLAENLFQRSALEEMLAWMKAAVKELSPGGRVYGAFPSNDCESFIRASQQAIEILTDVYRRHGPPVPEAGAKFAKPHGRCDDRMLVVEEVEEAAIEDEGPNTEQP